MSLTRARIVKAAAGATVTLALPQGPAQHEAAEVESLQDRGADRPGRGSTAWGSTGRGSTAWGSTPRGRRVPREVADAHVEADALLARARAEAERILGDARDQAKEAADLAARDAREAEIARVAAELLVERATAEARAERDLDRVVELAVVLAERLVGEALAIAPERAAALAVEALRATRGARTITIEACAEDAAAIGALLAELPTPIGEVTVDAALPRGSLIVRTEIGDVDARLAPQLARLGAALRLALATEAP